MRPVASDFDSEVFGLRVGWTSQEDFDPEGFDLVFLSGPWPARLHPRATLVDVRLDMVHRGLSDVPGPSKMVAPAAGGGDLAFAMNLASDAFASDSRYFADPRLRPRAPEVYRRWVLGAYKRGDLHVISGVGLLCVSRVPTAGPTTRIDLVAVAPDARRLGAGARLVQAFLSLPGEGERRVRVGAGNVAATNFYHACGFEVAAAESVQHVWCGGLT